jgi:cobalamin biosynthesis Mg chelatase CobN
MSNQATVVNLEMAQAAATQKKILEQSQNASTAEAFVLVQAATEQSQSAAATLSAYNVSVAQTAQAQAILDTQSAQTAEANATQTAFSLTATPLAALQADIARAKIEADTAARWQAYVVTPVKIGLWILGSLLLILAAGMAFRWLTTVIDPVSLPAPLLVLRPLIKPRIKRDENSQVEIVGPSEPSVINWIAEAEKQLRIRP